MFVNSWEFCELFKNAYFVEGLQRAGSETTVRGTFFAEHHLGRNGGGGRGGELDLHYDQTSLQGQTTHC